MKNEYVFAAVSYDYVDLATHWVFRFVFHLLWHKLTTSKLTRMFKTLAVQITQVGLSQMVYSDIYFLL